MVKSTPSFNAGDLEKALSVPNLRQDRLHALWDTHAPKLTVEWVRLPETIGIPVPDIMRRQFIAKPDDLPRTLETLRSTPSVRSYEVFPIGIVKPERYRITVNLGKRGQ